MLASELTDHSCTVDRQKVGRVQRLLGMDGIPAPTPCFATRWDRPFLWDSFWPEPLFVCQSTWVEAQLCRVGSPPQLKTHRGFFDLADHLL